MYNRFQFKEGQYVRLAEWDTHVNEYGAFSIDNPSSFSKSENVLKKTDSGISGIHVGKIKKIDYDGKLTLDASRASIINLRWLFQEIELLVPA